jgi:hypothetical protein
VGLRVIFQDINCIRNDFEFIDTRTMSVTMTGSLYYVGYFPMSENTSDNGKCPT